MSGDVLFPMGISMIIVNNPNALGPWEMERQVNGKALFWSICVDVEACEENVQSSFLLPGWIQPEDSHLQRLPTEIS